MSIRAHISAHRKWRLYASGVGLKLNTEARLVCPQLFARNAALQTRGSLYESKCETESTFAALWRPWISGPAHHVGHESRTFIRMLICIMPPVTAAIHVCPLATDNGVTPEVQQGRSQQTIWTSLGSSRDRIFCFTSCQNPWTDLFVHSLLSIPSLSDRWALD